jgi:hypothetical protein
MSEFETNDQQIADDENYVFKANLCTRLSRELNLSEIKYDVIGTYEPPIKPGLSNCNVIIPSYYNLHKHPSKILETDYYEMIKDDIRNCRVLNEYQLKYIKELSHESKNELFDIYNTCTKLYNDILGVEIIPLENV